MKWQRWSFVCYSDTEHTVSSTLLRHLFKQVDCVKNITPDGNFLRNLVLLAVKSVQEAMAPAIGMTTKSSTFSKGHFNCVCMLYITANNKLKFYVSDVSKCYHLECLPIKFRIHRVARKSVYQDRSYEITIRKTGMQREL